MTKTPACEPQVVKDLIRKHVDNSATISNVSGELAMSLPTEEEKKFSPLLKELSEVKDSIGVSSFGLSVTTLEDVFLKVGTMEDSELYKVSLISISSFCLVHKTLHQYMLYIPCLHVLLGRRRRKRRGE